MHVLSKPLIYALEITSDCNNKCPGCSNEYKSRRDSGFLHQYKEILKSIIPDATDIRITGGEPTLHPNFFEILEIATSYDAQVTIFTNGRWENPSLLLGQLQRLQNRDKLSGLLISLHGAHPESHESFTRVDGSFNETVKNIRLAVEHGIPVSLSTIITQRNYNQLEDVVKLGHELGTQHIAFNRYLGAPLPGIEPSLTELQLAVSEIEVMLKNDEPIKYGICIPQCFMPNQSEGCLAGVAYVSIDPWGNVRPCAHSPTIVGSLLDSSIEEIWHGEKMERWRGLMPQACTECAAYSTCHGGCRAIQELRVDGRDPLRFAPLMDFTPEIVPIELPESGCPKTIAQIRKEDFGYILSAHGRMIPVSHHAKELVDACNGTSTFAELFTHFGQDGLDLLGEMWELGLLEIT